MVTKIKLKKMILFFATLIVGYGVVSVIVWPAGCPTWKRQFLRSRFVLLQYWRLVDAYVAEHGGRIPSGIMDLFTREHSEEYRRQQLVRYGYNQNWKPAGWYTNDYLSVVCSDYVVVPLGTNTLLISERPMTLGKTEIIYTIYDTLSPCDKVESCVIDPKWSREEMLFQMERAFHGRD